REVGHPLVVEGDQVQRHLKLLCSRAARRTAAHLLHERTRVDTTPRPRLFQAFRIALGRTACDRACRTKRTLMPLWARSGRPRSVDAGAVLDGDHGDLALLFVDEVDHTVITAPSAVQPLEA